MDAKDILDDSQMTYGEVAGRVLEFMYVHLSSERPEVVAPHQDTTTPYGRWIHDSYRNRTLELMEKDRLAVLSLRTSRGASKAAIEEASKPFLASPRYLDPGSPKWAHPGLALEHYLVTFPEVSTMVLSAVNNEAWLGSMKAGGEARALCARRRP